jgi:3'-5' exoribonuclease
MFNGSLIINIEQIRTVVDRSEVHIEDFWEIVPGGIDLWLRKLIDLIDSVEDVDCRILINAFLNDAKFMECFKTSPGGLHIHHNYVGGLLEHTTNAMGLVSQFSDRHPGLINRDILVTGAFLHDIGKTREILWDITKDYTTEGKLLGQIVLGVMMFKEKVSTIPKFPGDLSILLLHLIASHHGNLEYGSPVKPSTPEALALHMMEAADARINHMYRHLNSSDPDRDWSSYDKILETQIYQKKYAKNIRQTSLIAV